MALVLVQDARAEQSGEKNSFDSADMTLVAQGNLDYTACLRSRALEELDSSPDVRVVADAAAAACHPVLDELRARPRRQQGQSSVRQWRHRTGQAPGPAAAVAVADDGAVPALQSIDPFYPSD